MRTNNSSHHHEKATYPGNLPDEVDDLLDLHVQARPGGIAPGASMPIVPAPAAPQALHRRPARHPHPPAIDLWGSE